MLVFCCSGKIKHQPYTVSESVLGYDEIMSANTLQENYFNLE